MKPETTKQPANSDKVDALVRLLIECIAQLACVIAILWLVGCDSTFPFWRFLVAGIILGIFTGIEKRQWIRKSNDPHHLRETNKGE